MTHDSNKDTPPGIYVGYLPMRRRQRVFVLVAAPLMVFGIGALAGAIALAQRDPGQTEQLVSSESEWRGTLLMEPFPLLAADDGHSYLLASTVKSGVADRVSVFAGMRCVLTGTAQARGGRRVLLLADGAQAVSAVLDGEVLERLPVAEPEQIRVVGEILDSKCYTGAMKPGDGKGHKACAILCLQGGIAAIVTSPDLTGDQALPLLRVDGSTQLSGEVLELVGEPVVIAGVLSREGGIPVLDSSTDQISRWKLGTNAAP